MSSPGQAAQSPEAAEVSVWEAWADGPQGTQRLLWLTLSFSGVEIDCILPKFPCLTSKHFPSTLSLFPSSNHPRFPCSFNYFPTPFKKSLPLFLWGRAHQVTWTSATCTVSVSQTSNFSILLTVQTLLCLPSWMRTSPCTHLYKYCCDCGHAFGQEGEEANSWWGLHLKDLKIAQKGKINPVESKIAKMGYL